MKKALAIRADKAEGDINDYELFLLPRSGDNSCESDPSFLQLIPYVVLFRNTEKNPEFLTYVRGSGGAEKRLVDKKSIGFGGHVDTMPDEGVDLVTHLANEAIRELKEELGIVSLTTEQVKDAICYTGSGIYPNEKSDEVSKVHLGILFFINAVDVKFGELEVGCIEQLEWVPLDALLRQIEIQKMVKSECLSFMYEEWSVVASTRI